MCGIAGVIGASSERVHLASTINASQVHRGPDASVVVELDHAVLASTRLAIQDPTPAGNQPFRSLDGRHVVVFNGELYNHRELATQHGLELRSRCDGAVIPLLWSRLGMQSIDLFRGMFAVAVYDTVEGSTTLFRDPFGMKPLHWWRRPDGSVLFASEIRPLLAAAGTPPLRREEIARYLRFGATSADASPFEGINAVPAGAAVVFAPGRDPVTVPCSAPLPAEPDDGGADLLDAFVESVRLHLGADVPTALLLSAGVDSTLIAAAAARLGRRVHGLTVRTPGAGDESPTAAETARHYDHDHSVVETETVSPATLTDFFSAMQRPTVDGLNTYLVCRAVRDAGYKVALSGVGGDEALGGYRHARALRQLRHLTLLDHAPRFVGRAAARVIGRVSGGASAGKLDRLVARDGPRSSWDLVALQRELFDRDTVAALTGVPTESRRGPGGDSHRELVRAEVAVYLRPMLLPDADAYSMASSVELRLPFVDRVMMAAAMATSREDFLGRGKGVLVDAFGDDYLARLSKRPKTGFNLPMAAWLSTGDSPLRGLVEETSAPDAPVWRVVDPGVGRKALAGWDGRRWSEPWAFVALNAWLSTLGS